jgi:hypothetical protein
MAVETLIPVEEYLRTSQEVEGDVIATEDPRLELTRAEIFQE